MACYGQNEGCNDKFASIHIPKIVLGECLQDCPLKFTANFKTEFLDAALDEIIQKYKDEC
jgi:hypothetical protein